MRIEYKGLRSGNSRVAIITYGDNEENKAYEIARKFTISTSYKVDTLVYGMLIIEVDDMNDFNNVKEWYKEFKADNTNNDTDSTNNDTNNINETTDSTDTTESDTTETSNNTTETSNNTTETSNNTTETSNNTTETSNNTTKNDINAKYGVIYNTITKLEKLFDTAEKYKNSYTWNKDNGNAQQREYKEKQDSIDEFEWYDNGDKYTAEYVVKISRTNVYAYGLYTKNEHPTTLTAVKNSYKRLLKAVQRE